MKQLALIFLAAITLAACGDKEEPEPTKPSKNYTWKVTSWYVDSSLIASANANGVRIVCEVLDSNGNITLVNRGFRMYETDTNGLASAKFFSVKEPMVDPSIPGHADTRGKWRIVFKRLD